MYSHCPECSHREQMAEGESPEPCLCGYCWNHAIVCESHDCMLCGLEYPELITEEQS